MNRLATVVSGYLEAKRNGEKSDQHQSEMIQEIAVLMDGDLEDRIEAFSAIFGVIEEGSSPSTTSD